MNRKDGWSFGLALCVLGTSQAQTAVEPTCFIWAPETPGLIPGWPNAGEPKFLPLILVQAVVKQANGVIIEKAPAAVCF